MNILSWIDQRKHWWKVFVLIFTVSVVVVGYIGYKTYQYAPPVCDFVDDQGNVVFSAEDINGGVRLRVGEHGIAGSAQLAGVAPARATTLKGIAP